MSWLDRTPVQCIRSTWDVVTASCKKASQNGSRAPHDSSIPSQLYKYINPSLGRYTRTTEHTVSTKYMQH